MSKSLVFVYGTLKQAYGNNCLLKGSKFVSRARTQEKFAMYCNGGFPYVTDKEKTTIIQGEVYEVTPETLASLDMLEGAGRDERNTHYNRKVVSVVLEDKTTVDVFMYIVNDRIDLTRFTPVSTGFWVSPRKQIPMFARGR